MKQSVNVTCDDTALINPEKLTPFQGDLKTLSDDRYQKLRASLLKHGFSFPVYAWKNDKQTFVIDAHQRLIALRRMQDEGISLVGGKVPVIYVHAKDKRQAKELVLAAMSEYGKYDGDSIYAFVKQSDLVWGDLKEFVDFPAMDMEKLNVGWFLPEWSEGTQEGELEGERFTLYAQANIVDDAMAHYRKTGFPYRAMSLHAQKQELNALAQMPTSALLSSHCGGGVADAYNPHRYDVPVEGKRAPSDGFKEDKWLRHALELALKTGPLGDGFLGTFSFTLSAQLCANYRPAYARMIYERYGHKGGRTLDPCAGFGGRVLGWHASKLGGTYVGVDPSKLTVKGNQAMIEALEIKGASIIESPFEDVTKEALGKVDFAFTSPPYFKKEKYSKDDTQSYLRYRKIQEWGEGFLKKMMANVYAALKQDRFFVVNIADVKLGSGLFSLEDMTKKYAKYAGFELKEVLQMPFSTVPGTGATSKPKTEPVFIFQK